jgi:hypothetical protein
MGPSISDVGRSMQDKGLGSKEKRALSKRSLEKIMGQVRNKVVESKKTDLSLLFQ